MMKMINFQAPGLQEAFWSSKLTIFNKISEENDQFSGSMPPGSLWELKMVNFH